MSESITLPRSGIVLPEPSEHQPGVWWLPADVGWICDPEHSLADPKAWTAWYDSDDATGTREECIAWLDERVLALRSALLPRDAVERVARALWYRTQTTRFEYSNVSVQEAFKVEAKAVLSALGVDHA